MLVINEVDVSYNVVEEKLKKSAEKKSGVEPVKKSVCKCQHRHIQ